MAYVPCVPYYALKIPCAAPDAHCRQGPLNGLTLSGPNISFSSYCRFIKSPTCEMVVAGDPFKAGTSQPSNTPLKGLTTKEKRHRRAAGHHWSFFSELWFLGPVLDFPLWKIFSFSLRACNMTLILNDIACHRHINKDIKGTNDYHLLGWVLDFFFLVIYAIPYVRLTYVVWHGLHTRGCIRPR